MLYFYTVIPVLNLKILSHCVSLFMYTVAITVAGACTTMQSEHHCKDVFIHIIFLIL